MSRISLMAALAAAAISVGTAQAQVNFPVPGPYGAEDGYNDDGFGWGPAYRPETSFRPSYGFYGGVERPYPYARYPQADETGTLDDADEEITPAPRRPRSHAQVKRSADHRNAGHSRRARTSE